MSDRVRCYCGGWIDMSDGTCTSDDATSNRATEGTFRSGDRSERKTPESLGADATANRVLLYAAALDKLADDLERPLDSGGFAFSRKSITPEIRAIAEDLRRVS